MVRSATFGLAIASVLALIFGFGIAAAVERPQDFGPSSDTPKPPHDENSAAVGDGDFEFRNALRAQLLEGVEQLAKPGVPGPVFALGPNAVPLAVGVAGGVRMPVAVATPFGQGRIASIGHGGYFEARALGEGDTARFVINVAQWLRGGNSCTVVAIDAPDVMAVLDGMGVPVRSATRPTLAETLIELDGVGVIVLDVPHGISDELCDQILSFVERGGGLLTAQLGWGWLQLHPGQSLTDDHPANRLLSRAGIVYADGYLDGIGPASRTDLDNVMPSRAVEPMLSNALSGEPLRQATGIVETALQAVTGEDPFLLPRLREATLEFGASIAPTEDRPIRATDSRRRLGLLLEHREVDARWRQGEPIRAFAGSEFPGSPNDSAEIETADPITVRLDPRSGGWMSTGLYAQPGRSIEVASSSILGLTIQIGCHTDRLWHKPQWQRHPEITHRTKLEGESVSIISPHGGLIYFDMSRRSEPFDIVVSGAVRAPRFVLGTTTNNAWCSSIRRAPGPWAELETSKIILTVPSSEIRTLDDPESLMQTWDRVLDCYAELGSRPLPSRPERIVADVQISAGYMHSGYPIMTHLDAAPRMVDHEMILGRPEPKVWGLWHELGHNHQQSDWTFSGSTEVTCNLFTLYVLDKISGVKPVAHPRFGRLADQFERHRARGAPFAEWKRDPFLALWMYVQLQDAFGWQAFQKVFAQYRDLPEGERPKNDAEKRDQWLVRMSRVTGRNLAPFFEAWGIPTTESARASVDDLDEFLLPWKTR